MVNAGGMVITEIPDCSPHSVLVNMDGDWMMNVWDAQCIERAYLLAGPRMAARVKKTEDIPFADSDANQLNEKELVQSLNACTVHWKQDWEVQPRLPIKYEKGKFDEVFQETGIAVLQFAREKSSRNSKTKQSTEQRVFQR